MRLFIIGLCLSIPVFLIPTMVKASTFPWEYRYENCATATDGTDHSICLDSTSGQIFKCSSAGGICTTLMATKPNIVTVTQSATPAILVTNANRNVFSITGLAQAITSMSSGLSGTPTNGEIIEIQITDNGTAQVITWGTSFSSSTVTLPSTTVINTMLSIVVQYDSTSGEWICKGVA